MKSILKEYFQNSVAQYPEQTAIEIQGQKYSYEALNSAVQKLVNCITQQGIENKAVVVLNDHSFYSYAGLLAVNFSGNTILPLEQTWPKQRIATIIKEVRPAALLLSNKEEETMSLLHELEEFKVCSIIDTALATVIDNPATSNVGKFKDYEDIAYIIFTSGSTGQPKGVPVKNVSLSVFLDYFINTYDFSYEDRFLQVYDITFDVTYFSFLVPLCCGACCCILNSKKGVPKYLFIINDLLKLNITVVSMVPTVLHFIKKYINKGKVASLRYSFFSGDALYHSDALQWQKFVPNAKIHNFYGPTETTIVCTRYIWEREKSGSECYNDIVPLGKPFPGIKYRIVDDYNHKLPEGEVGELAFAGKMVIESYLENVHQEKFFQVEGESSKEVYYRTGDLASVNHSGNLIFHGRTDHQVKINGYRIELEEVRLALEKATRKKCVIVRKRNNEHVDFLKAFIEGENENIDEIVSRLKNYLPEYMIPKQYVFIKQIPLSENNKIDKVYLEQL